MRLRRLDLVRFGHFTDAAFDLPASDVDFHIIYGPNEAGKSTALSAIEDLLFGIPMRSPYNFLHDYKDLRIGAVLERDGSLLEVRRRKGSKETLLDTEDLPLSTGDAALKPFLEGADRAFFERMFSLDHARLERGGQEILRANDEVGQLLFSAGTGIGGLRDRLTKLDQEADSLWGPRRAAKRLYTQAEGRLDEAKRMLREQLVTAKHWNELRRAFEDAEELCSEIDQEIRKKSAEAKRLGRIRRVYRYVRQKSDVEERIAGLGAVVPLPDDASETLASAERDESVAGGSIETVAIQLSRARDELEGLSYDEGLLARADDIRMLNERRIEVRRENSDLPKRKAELDAAEKDLRAAAKELGWVDPSVDELVKRIPTRGVVKTVSVLIGKRGELAADDANAKRELEEAEAEARRLEQGIRSFGELPDISNLAAAAAAIRQMGDIGALVHSAEKKVLDATKRVERFEDVLNPHVESVGDVAAMKVPARGDIQQVRDDIRECERRGRETSGQIEDAENELGITRTEFEQTVRDEHAITRRELEDSRDERDALWDLVKRKHIEIATIGEEECAKYSEELRDLPRGFEAKIRAADQVADDRFDNAEASGRLAEMSRAIELKEERIGQLRKTAEVLKSEREQLDARWAAMWSDAPFEPLPPDSMLEWLNVREELLEAIETQESEAGLLNKTLAQEQEAKETLLKEMVALGVERGTLGDARLRVVLERASDLVQQHVAEVGKLKQLKDGLADAQHEAERRQRDARRANEAWANWDADWASALEGLGLAASLGPAGVEGQVDVIDQMREKETQIRNLRHERIAKIERDIQDFAEVTAALVEAVAPDLSEQAVDDAVLELVKQLDDAERVRGLQKSKRSDVNAREEEISRLEKTRDAAMRSVRHLHEAAGTDSVDALRQAIAKSNQLREYRSKLSELAETLEKEGDGLSVDDLEKECATIDVDEIAAIEETNAAQLEDLDGRRTTATEARSQARTVFEAVGGDSAAARAASEQQEAFSEMGGVAERYARVRTSAILLKWAIDRFRREKQAPRLKRAGELFATLTGGSFRELRIDYDDNDAAQLIGRRLGGGAVEVSGMSSGTADQLYLALRVASVEDYLARASELPFIADDLFVNFDDERAGAGFQVLAQLAKKTQVLFFTHHQHLVDVAREALGGPVSVVSLGDAPP